MNARELVSALATPAQFKKPGTWAKLLDLFPTGREAVISFKDSPTCGSCRASLIKLFLEYPDKANQLVQMLQPGAAFDATDGSQGVGNVTISKVSLAGHVDVVEDTPEAYSALLRRIQQEGTFFYSGLSVVPREGNRLAVYFY